MDLGVKKKYMIFSIVTNTTKDNRPFIRMTLTDTDGASMNAIMFDSNKLSFSPERSQIVEVTGALQQYNGVTQLKVSDMTLLEGEDTNEFLHDYSDFFEVFTRGIDEGIRLRDGVTVEQLWKKCLGRCCLPS